MTVTMDRSFGAPIRPRIKAKNPLEIGLSATRRLTPIPGKNAPPGVEGSTVRNGVNRTALVHQIPAVPIFALTRFPANAFFVFKGFHLFTELAGIVFDCELT